MVESPVVGGLMVRPVIGSLVVGGLVEWTRDGFTQAGLVVGLPVVGGLVVRSPVMGGLVVGPVIGS